MPYPQETYMYTTLDSRSLLGRRRNAVRSRSLRYQLDVLRKTGRYDAFKLQWNDCYRDEPDVWPVPNHLFWDSDVAKWIEGACYFLYEVNDAEIENAIHELVDMIRSAQQPDGYINIHFTVVEPSKRFTNIRDLHELYNAGHLIEAALAHHAYFGNNQLLEPVLKYVDLLCQTFGPDDHQIHGYPGHPEIELALLRLHKRTGRDDILKLARYFITERGNPTAVDGKHYYVAEAEARGDDPNKRPAYWGDFNSLWYYQAHVPLVEQNRIEGHSVRAMYLLTAAADLVRLQDNASKDAALNDAVSRLWRNMVDQKMYMTGGIGAIKQWEGFGTDYFLPQGTDEGGCYAETCAGIGVMMLANRLLETQLDGEVGDIMELCLYNAVLTSMSHDGTKFTYVNQLTSSDQDLSKREEWFTCACCPPNMLRTMGLIGGYATTFNIDSREKAASIAVHLFTSSTVKFNVGDDEVELTQQTDWPWSGNVEFKLRTLCPSVQIHIRCPSWSSEIKIMPDCTSSEVRNGYLSLPAAWLTENPTFTLTIPMKPRVLSPHPYTNQNTVALARGPIIYCVEDVDNTWVRDHFKDVQLDPSCQIEEQKVKDEVSGDEYVKLTVRDAASHLRLENITGPSSARPQSNKVETDEDVIDELHFVPYYFRANRGGRGQMRVGLKRWNR